MDEHKHIVMIPVPVMSKERFAAMTGLREGQVRGMARRLKSGRWQVGPRASSSP